MEYGSKYIVWVWNEKKGCSDDDDDDDESVGLYDHYTAQYVSRLSIVHGYAQCAMVWCARCGWKITSLE